MVSSIYRQTKFSTIASAVLRDHKEFQGFTGRSFTYENIRLGIVARGTKGSLQKQQKAVDEKGPKRVYGISLYAFTLPKRFWMR